MLIITASGGTNPKHCYIHTLRFRVNTCHICDEVANSARVTILVVVLDETTISKGTFQSRKKQDDDRLTQLMSLIKLALRGIPALASKMEDSVVPTKSVETTSSSV